MGFVDLSEDKICIYFNCSLRISATSSEGVLFDASAFVLSFPIKSTSNSISSFSVDKSFTLSTFQYELENINLQ